MFIASLFFSCKRDVTQVERVERTRKKARPRISPAPTEIKEEKFLYASHNRRDPFVPLLDRKGRPITVVEGGVQFKVSDLYLEGIIWDDIKPMAIINDEVVSAGDKIRGVEIVDIQKDKVILSYQDEIFELKME